MATYKIPYENLTFNLPDEGTVFRAVGDNAKSAYYKVVNGQIQNVGGRHIANWDLRAPDGTLIPSGTVLDNLSVNWQQARPVDPNVRGASVTVENASGAYNSQYGNGAYEALPEFNMADIQTVLNKTGGKLPTGNATQTVDPTNPNGVVVKDSTGVISAPNPAPQVGAMTPGSTPQSNVNPNAVNPQTGTYSPPQATQSATPTPFGSGVTPLGGASGTSGGSNGTGTGTPGAPDLSGLPPEFQQLYSQLSDYLAKLQKNGQVLNPNIELTPDKVAEFLNQAHSEIDPYYSTQLKLATDALQSSINYGKQNLLTDEQRAQTKYGTQLRTLGENAADQGFAQSGLRSRDERTLATDTQNTINDARSQFGYNAGNAARTFAQSYGGANIPQFNISETPQVAAGESTFGQTGRSLPLYQLSPDLYNGLVGTEQYNQTAAVKNRASDLESAFRSNQSIAQQRQLTL